MQAYVRSRDVREAIQKEQIRLDFGAVTFQTHCI